MCAQSLRHAQYGRVCVRVCLFSAGGGSECGFVAAAAAAACRNFRTLTAPTAVQFVSLAVEPAGEVVVAGTQDDFQVCRVYVFVGFECVRFSTWGLCLCLPRVFEVCT